LKLPDASPPLAMVAFRGHAMEEQTHMLHRQFDDPDQEEILTLFRCWVETRRAAEHFSGRDDDGGFDATLDAADALEDRIFRRQERPGWRSSCFCY
jgi:hypothetical protein